MTQEEKQLLLKDLCARLPYEVKLDNGLKLRSIDVLTKVVSCSGSDRRVDYVRPYLRPMSSMTEEENEEWFTHYNTIEKNFLEKSDYTDYFGACIVGDAAKYDWLNEHHFDYRGLIEKGLALEAPEGMYKTE